MTTMFGSSDDYGLTQKGMFSDVVLISKCRFTGVSILDTGQNARFVHHGGVSPTGYST